MKKGVGEKMKLNEKPKRIKRWRLMKNHREKSAERSEKPKGKKLELNKEQIGKKRRSLMKNRR